MSSNTNSAPGAPTSPFGLDLIEAHAQSMTTTFTKAFRDRINENKTRIHATVSAATNAVAAWKQLENQKARAPLQPEQPDVIDQQIKDKKLAAGHLIVHLDSLLVFRRTTINDFERWKSRHAELFQYSLMDQWLEAEDLVSAGESTLEEGLAARLANNDFCGLVYSDWVKKQATDLSA